MREFFEFRVNKKFSYLLPDTISGKDLGSVIKIQIDKNSIEFDIIKRLNQKIKETEKESFFYGWNIKRKYSRKEFDNAKLLHLIIDTTFEPAGEECGTLYDETTACLICGAGRTQISPLRLKKSSIPKKDIARTIAGEVIVSEKFAMSIKKWGLNGLILKPIDFNKQSTNYYQLLSSPQVELSKNTLAGVNPFDFSNSCEGSEFSISGGYHFKFGREFYNCPNGDTLGLNLLSAPFILNCSAITNSDFLESKQKLGVKRGLLRPEPLYFCSTAFRQMIQDEKLTGFSFEIATIE
jgi:hypothetical protein